MNTLDHPTCEKVKGILIRLKGKGPEIVKDVVCAGQSYLAAFVYKGKSSQGNFWGSWFVDLPSDVSKEQKIKAELNRAISALK